MIFSQEVLDFIITSCIENMELNRNGQQCIHPQQNETFRWQTSVFLAFILMRLMENLHFSMNCIGGVMVSMLASSAVDHGIKPLSCQRLSDWYLLLLR
jgi:hypothetical protein